MKKVFGVKMVMKYRLKCLSDKKEENMCLWFLNKLECSLNRTNCIIMV